MQRNGLSHKEAGKLGAEITKEFWTKQKEKAIQNYYMSPQICKECDTIILYEQRKTAKNFCSRSCSAKFHNRNKIITYKCIVCNGSITGNNKNQRRFCSNKCQKQHEWNLRKTEIEITGIAPYVKTAKRFLQEKFGHMCQICKNTEWMDNPIPLILDHMDGNPENNIIVNLRLVCGNCDMQLPTYKGKKCGNGRFARRKRRAEGKSY